MRCGHGLRYRKGNSGGIVQRGRARPVPADDCPVRGQNLACSVLRNCGAGLAANPCAERMAPTFRHDPCKMDSSFCCFFFSRNTIHARALICGFLQASPTWRRGILAPAASHNPPNVEGRASCGELSPTFVEPRPRSRRPARSAPWPQSSSPETGPLIAPTLPRFHPRPAPPPF
jgi:hypothetical protein